MTDDVLLYLMGQICELKTCRGRSSLGDRIRRHRSKLAGAAQRSAARSAGAGRGSADNCDEVIIRLSAAGLAPWQGEKRRLRRPFRTRKKGRLQKMQLLSSSHRNSQC